MEKLVPPFYVLQNVRKSKSQRKTKYYSVVDIFFLRVIFIFSGPNLYLYRWPMTAY